MKISNNLIAGLDDLIATLSRKGNSNVRTITVEREFIEVEKIRRDLGMTQKQFAISFGFPLKTLQNWEQNVREPDGPTRAYLQVIRRQPAMVLSALHGW